MDVEDWYHILDSPAAPPIDIWSALESRIERNIRKILEIFDENRTRATFFWLGWVAERHKQLVRMCQNAGHEIASHGYGHVLAQQAGVRAFREDVIRAKNILEDTIGQPVPGFRAAGFGFTNQTPWAFDAIKEVGHYYDSSVFPTSHGHGGMKESPLKPYVIRTPMGPLIELPASAVELFGGRYSFFGGGYLRLSPLSVIRWGIRQLNKKNRPLIIYIHPREIDPTHPRLPLNLLRRFKCYVNLKSTLPKIEWLCGNYVFLTMSELAETVTDRENLPDNRLR